MEFLLSKSLFLTDPDSPRPESGAIPTRFGALSA